ncbi:MAG: CopG family transcriptional regulator [Novosphingobium sp.]
MTNKQINADEFDRLFDEGSDEIDKYVDWNSFRRPGLEPKRVNVDFPQWMVNRLDREAQRLGITRQALIKTWVAAKLDAAA